MQTHVTGENLSFALARCRIKRVMDLRIDTIADEMKAAGETWVEMLMEADG